MTLRYMDYMLSKTHDNNWPLEYNRVADRVS